MWFFMLVLNSAFGGPWVQEPGNGYTRVGYRMYSSTEGFRRGQATGLTYEAHSATAYTEWGLPGGLQVIADMPFVWAAQRTADGIGYHHDWTGDVRLELDYAVLPSARSTVGVEVRLPTYKRPMEYAAVKNLPEEDFDALKANFPEIGDKCVDVTVKWMAGVGFNRGWLGASLGPRLRTNGFKHQVWGSLQGGVWIVPKRLTAGIYTEGAVALPIGNVFNQSRSFVYTQAQFMVAEPKVMPGWALEFGVGGVPVGDNVSVGYDFSVGVSYRRQQQREP